MKPILFDKSAKQFNTNGLGRLDCIDCTVTEERNGIYELEMNILEDANHVKEIGMDSIIVVKPNQCSANQAFRVYQISTPIDGKITVMAQHISYQLSYIPTLGITVEASPDACNLTLGAFKTNALEECPFTFKTDVKTVARYDFKQPASIRSRLGGSEGSVLDQFGGEYEWDNYEVYLHQHRGTIFPKVTLSYGKNITDLKQEEKISNVVTGVVPFWQDSEGTELLTLPEKTIKSQYASNYPFQRTLPLDLSQTFEEKPTEAELRKAATDYVKQTGLGVPEVSITLSFINLSDTEEYRDIAQLQTVSLCDLINVRFEKLGINTTAKVIKTEYDVLNERYISIDVGTVKSTLAKTITSTNGMIESAVDKAVYLSRNATAWLTNSNGYVMAVKNDDGTWKELLFMDKPVAEEAKNVLRINENGIGFSSSGVNGTYQNAWTIDGHLVADFVDSGTLRGVTIIAGGVDNKSGTFKALDAKGTDIVEINKDGIVVKKGTINGADIVVGGVDNKSGTITMQNASGEQLGYWNNAELNVGNGATKLDKNGINTKFLDCSSSSGEAWFPNAIFINRAGNGKIESRSFAVNTWDNKNGGMIEAYQDGIITITKDLWIAGTLRNSSDRRLKTDIKALTDSVELIKKLKPVSFRMKDNPKHIKHGFIAQDIKPLSNDGEWDVWVETEQGIQTISYTELIADIVSAEKEIIKRLEKLEKGSKDANS